MYKIPPGGGEGSIASSGPICRISLRLVPKFDICHENSCIFFLLSEVPLNTPICEAVFKCFHLKSQSIYLIYS